MKYQAQISIQDVHISIPDQLTVSKTASDHSILTKEGVGLHANTRSEQYFIDGLRVGDKIKQNSAGVWEKVR
jgi:hypothetical protein